MCGIWFGWIFADAFAISLGPTHSPQFHHELEPIGRLYFSLPSELDQQSSYFWYVECLVFDWGVFRLSVAHFESNSLQMFSACICKQCIRAAFIALEGVAGWSMPCTRIVLNSEPNTSINFPWESAICMPVSLIYKLLYINFTFSKPNLKCC